MTKFIPPLRSVIINRGLQRQETASLLVNVQNLYKTNVLKSLPLHTQDRGHTVAILNSTPSLSNKFEDYDHTNINTPEENTNQVSISFIPQQRHDNNDGVHKQVNATQVAFMIVLEHHNNLIMTESLLHTFNMLLKHLVHFETSRHDIA